VKGPIRRIKQPRYSYSPYSIHIKLNIKHRVAECDELVLAERLGHHVGGLVVGRDPHRHRDLVEELLAPEPEPVGVVLGPAGDAGLHDRGHGGAVVAHDLDRRLVLALEEVEHVHHEAEVLGGVGVGGGLGLSGALRDDLELARRVGDGRAAVHNHMAGEGLGREEPRCVGVHLEQRLVAVEGDSKRQAPSCCRGMRGRRSRRRRPRATGSASPGTGSSHGKQCRGEPSSLSTAGSP